MRMKPILFSGEMVRAILEGRKRQTRRVVKPQPDRFFEVNESPLYLYDVEFNKGLINSPYQPGDVLIVASEIPGIPTLFLKVTEVRVERLQEITEEDAGKEGLQNYYGKRAPYCSNIIRFADLWDSINGKKYPWASNPWVWVIEFERSEKP